MDGSLGGDEVALRRLLKCITYLDYMATRKRPEDNMGIVLPEKQTARPLSVRLTKDDLRKLSALGRRLKVGPSTMARLIVEKFIKEHDPDR